MLSRLNLSWGELLHLGLHAVILSKLLSSFWLLATSVARQFAIVAQAAQQTLPGHFQVIMAVTDGMQRFGALLVVLALGWLIWQVLGVRRPAALLRVMYGLNVLMLSAFLWLMWSSLTLIQGRLLPLVGAP